jgi:hypothetical protein
MVTNVGNTTDKVIISDNATPASGTWAVYLNPKQITGPKETTVFLLNEIAGSDTLIETWGGRAVQVIFRNCEWDLSGAGGNMELLKRARQYWNANSTTLYLAIKDKNGYNQATLGNDAGSAVVQIQCRIQDVNEHNEDAENHVFDVTVVGANVT